MPIFKAWGSCITRDALEFVADATIAAFSSRGSIVSACTSPIPQDKLQELFISQEIGDFSHRVIEDDVYKRGVARINKRPDSATICDMKILPETILIIDLTEERTQLLTDGEGHFVTHSKEAFLYSNLKDLFSVYIEPFSTEYVDLVIKYLPVFAHKISKSSATQIVIHRALFAETNPSYVRYNDFLIMFYDLLAKLLPGSISIEVPKELRVSSVMHKWGSYGLHMGDEYYKYFLHLISKKLGIPIQIKNDFSIQNMEGSCFFKDSYKYCNILNDMYGKERSPYWLSRMQYLYIVERELEKREYELAKQELVKQELEDRILTMQNSGNYVLKAEITSWWLLKKATKRVLRKTKNWLFG